MAARPTAVSRAEKAEGSEKMTDECVWAALKLCFLKQQYS